MSKNVKLWRSTFKMIKDSHSRSQEHLKSASPTSFLNSIVVCPYAKSHSVSLRDESKFMTELYRPQARPQVLDSYSLILAYLRNADYTSKLATPSGCIETVRCEPLILDRMENDHKLLEIHTALKHELIKAGLCAKPPDYDLGNSEYVINKTIPSNGPDSNLVELVCKVMPPAHHVKLEPSRSVFLEALLLIRNYILRHLSWKGQSLLQSDTHLKDKY